jgi:HlyD family secretion protein
MTRAPSLPAALAAAAVALTGCRREPAPDAFGNFEAVEVVVAAQTSGQVLRFEPAEGARLAAGSTVVTVDTIQLALERATLEARRAAGDARRAEARQQVDALGVQREIARRAYARTRRLYADRAATAQQLDQAERDARVLDAQLAGAAAQARGAGDEVAAAAAQLAQVADRLARSRVVNPVAGTVLATYARAGEFVQTGQPLYRIANLDTLELRAYVAQPQLARLRLGQRVAVSVDRADDDRLVVPGTVSWVASRAEFTPTPVETRDERASLVYAIKVRVPNRDGALKIGMPADVALAPAVASAGRAR